MPSQGVYRKRPLARPRRMRRAFLRAIPGVMAVPSAPSLDAVTVDAAGLYPDWSDTDGGASHILFYEVWRSVNGAGYGLFYTSPEAAVTDTTDATTVEGQVVSYKVRAKNGGGYSSFSNVITQTSQGPDLLPRETGASATATTLTVTYSEDVVGVIANQYALATGHTLSNPVGNGSGGLHGDVWTFTISPAPVHGETLTLSYAGSSTKDDTNNLLAAFSGRAVTNNVPLDVPTIDPDSTGADPTATVLGWFAVPGATGYRVQRSLDGSAWGTPVVLGNVTSYSDTTTTLGVSYYYRVAAADSTSQSQYCDAYGPIEALGPGGVGGSPLTAPVIAFLDSTPAPSIVIDLTTAASGGQAPLRYDLYRSTTSGFTPSGSPVIADATFPANDTDAALAHGVLYYYKVVVTDGLGQTATSAQVSAGLPYDGTGGSGGGTGSAPTAPTLSDAEALVTGVQLSWTSSDFVSAAVTSYSIERKLAGGSFAQIHAQADYASGYLDPGTTVGQSVTYRVRARNAVGYSAYSNELTITSAGPGAVGDLITSDRAQQNATLAALATSDATKLAALITAASEAIKQACCRDFVQQSYTEYHSGENYPGQMLITRQFPVISVARVATSPTGVLLIANTSTANQRATVATTSTGLTLTRVASGVTTTDTLAYASYVTLDALAAAVDALGNGWDATVQASYGQWPSADLKPLQGAVGATPATSGAMLEMYVEDLSPLAWDFFDPTYGALAGSAGWRLDDETGQLFGYFPRGVMNIRVDYTAGYATIPEPIQQACVFLAADMLAADKRDGGVKSARIGPYQYELVDGARQLAKSPKVMSLIAPYVDHAARQGRHP